MQTVQGFVDTVVVPDLLAIAPYYKDLATVGKGVGNFLSWGVLDEKSQDPYDRVFPRGGIFGGVLKPQQVDPNETKMYTKHSFYPDSLGGGKHPLEVGQEPQQYVDLAPIEGAKLPNDKYDWTQAVRYGSQEAPMEVGPLAQMLMAYTAGRPEAVQLVDSTLAAVGAAGHPEILISALGRIVARVLKLKINMDNAQRWADELLANMAAGDTAVNSNPTVPDSGEGYGGWDAPRGALCHYVRIKGGKIGSFAAVPASNWNFSPRDDKEVRGPVEEALVGLPVADAAQPLEILRLVHTFDP